MLLYEPAKKGSFRSDIHGRSSGETDLWHVPKTHAYFIFLGYTLRDYRYKTLSGLMSSTIKLRCENNAHILIKDGKIQPIIAFSEHT